MDAKGREIADFMQRRRIGIFCVQETRWKGIKLRNYQDKCKLIYSSANSKGRNRENEEFCSALDCEMLEIPVEVGKKCFIGGDLNGHIGREAAVTEIVHGGWEIGIRNNKANSVTDFVDALDLAVINTFFMNTEN
uniref:Uncharacterized protein LOC114348277 n=1 Tax=Diabrotica virgifera virgifera TaxID=50390 RepID=A0A6P7GZ28_DIAVI